MSMVIDFYIYQHRRATDGKVFYVGKGHKGRAWSKDRRNAYWRNVVTKHGYTVEILEDGLQAWYAYEREIEVIAQRVESGCRLTNLTSGGDGVIGYEWTDAHRLKISSASQAMWQSDEYRKKVVQRAGEGQRRIWQDPEYRALAIARMQSGIDPVERSRLTTEHNKRTWANSDIREKRIAGIKSAKADPDYREAENARLREMWADDKRKQALRDSKRAAMKPIKCVETGVVFDAIKAAVRWLIEQGFASASKSNIKAVCTGKMKTAYGYRWQFSDGGV